jgi:hypothetical protein
VVSVTDKLFTPACRARGGEEESTTQPGMHPTRLGGPSYKRHGLIGTNGARLIDFPVEKQPPRQLDNRWKRTFADVDPKWKRYEMMDVLYKAALAGGWFQLATTR